MICIRSSKNRNKPVFKIYFFFFLLRQAKSVVAIRYDRNVSERIVDVGGALRTRVGFYFQSEGFPSRVSTRCRILPIFPKCPILADIQKCIRVHKRLHQVFACKRRLNRDSFKLTNLRTHSQRGCDFVALIKNFATFNCE